MRAAERPPLRRAGEVDAVIVHLVDGTYELFRHYFALPSHVTASGIEVAALRGVLGNVLGLIEGGATHVGVATDHVIESFRNELWPGYKTGAGVDPPLMSQFRPLEDALASMGVVVWPTVEWEADDALASASEVASSCPEVDRVVICTPDKDLGQCVSGRRVVQWDRRRDVFLDEAGIVAKFGVAPGSIPDWLALVGDSADGFPGIPGFGAKTAAALLSRFRHIDAIPDDADAWDVGVRGAAKLAATLRDSRDLAALFLDLATLRKEPPVLTDVEDLRWSGPTAGFAALARELDAADVAARAAALVSERG